jgi:hypothetical protein
MLALLLAWSGSNRLSVGRTVKGTALQHKAT